MHQHWCEAWALQQSLALSWELPSCCPGAQHQPWGQWKNSVGLPTDICVL